MYEYVYVYEKRSDKPYFLIHHQKTMQPLGQARKPIKGGSMCAIMLCVCVWIRVCVCMYMCMYKCMSMRMCTRYGLNDRDSYSSSRWDKAESQYKCVDNVSNHAVSMCKSMYVYLYVCV